VARPAEAAPGALRRLAASLAEAHGLELVGVAAADPLPAARRHMRESVAAGRMARMDWMGGERPDVATDPRRHEPDARSVLVVAAPYAAAAERGRWDPSPRALAEALAPILAAEPAEPAGLIARYAQGTDYHAALRLRLADLAADLRAHGVGVSPTTFVDDRPMAERAYAAAAGVGWIGKNSNLLTHRSAGSWVLLGELLLTDELAPDAPLRSSCGSCTRCLEGCPTGAIVAPQTIDARRCISYLTIEHPGAFSDWEADALGAWIFGCDVCQEVCPVNREAADDGPLHVPLIPLVEWLTPLGARAFDRAVGHTALRRATRHRLLRNALATLANTWQAEGSIWPAATRSRAQAAAEGATTDRRPDVRQAAERTLAILAAGEGQQS
jgi:epoxyqueuosine reductase